MQEVTHRIPQAGGRSCRGKACVTGALGLGVHLRPNSGQYTQAGQGGESWEDTSLQRKSHKLGRLQGESREVTRRATTLGTDVEKPRPTERGRRRSGRSVVLQEPEIWSVLFKWNHFLSKCWLPILFIVLFCF